MAEISKSIENNGEANATGVPVGAPIDLHRPSVASKLQAAKDLASSDEKMVKAQVLPPLPDFPKPESLDSTKGTKTYDANKKVLSDTVTAASSPSGSTDLRAVTQYDASGTASSLETSWTDAKGSKHDVVEGSGVVTNTIIDGANTSKLITRADGSWEHDVDTPGHSTITKVEKDHTVSQAERDLKKGSSQELVTHPNGFTEEITTRKGFKETLTKDSFGVVRFDAIAAAQTVDGKSDYHLAKRTDKKGNVESDDSHWVDKKGVYHEDDLLNFGDRSKIHQVTTGDTTKVTTTGTDGKSKTVQVNADGSTTDLP